MNRKPIFDAVRKLLGRPLTDADVRTLDKAIDAASGALPANEPPTPPTQPHAETKAATRTLGAAGAALIKTWEGCHKLRADGRFDAYPDPGSTDGKPWTIGWGSTGADVRKGVVWTRAQCDARFETDMGRYVAEVARALGDAPTTANQFDALVSFHYNTGAIFSAGLTRLHKQGDYAAAAREFGKWIYNAHKVLPGLVKRRAAEAKLYAAP